MGNRSFNYFEAGPSADPDYLAWAAQLTVAPDPTRAALLEQIFISLKAAGVFSKLDRLWIYAMHDSQAARVSLVNPTSTQIALINGGPNFVVDKGWFYNGTTRILNSQYQDFTDAINLQAGDASYISGHFNYAVGNVGMQQGALTAGGAGTRIRVKQLLGGQQRAQIQRSAIVNMGNPDPALNGLWNFTKVGTTVQSWFNGAALLSVSQTGVIRTALDQYLGTVNRNGTIINTQDADWFCHGYGAALNAAENTALKDALKTYTDAIGLNVIP